MTFEELNGDYSIERMDSVIKALEEVLRSALPQGCITTRLTPAPYSPAPYSPNYPFHLKNV